MVLPLLGSGLPARFLFSPVELFTYVVCQRIGEIAVLSRGCKKTKRNKMKNNNIMVDSRFEVRPNDKFIFKNL